MFLKFSFFKGTLVYFSSQKRCNETNESDEKSQENTQEEDKKLCFLCNEEECEVNAEDSIWLQCDKCNFWGNVYYILHIAEQEGTEKILTCSTEPWICQNCL